MLANELRRLADNPADCDPDVLLEAAEWVDQDLADRLVSMHAQMIDSPSSWIPTPPSGGTRIPS
jgi:hypothetical protein